MILERDELQRKYKDLEDRYIELSKKTEDGMHSYLKELMNKK